MDMMIAAAGLLGLAPGECRTLFDLGERGEFSRWQVVNDGVMGGRSRGGIAPLGQAMGFSGRINTDGGGFSSIQRPLASGSLAGAGRLRIVMKADARAYQLSMRSDTRFYGRSVAYRADLNPVGAGEWKVASVDLGALEPSVFGRKVPARPFDPAAAESLGFILADGQDGDFAMQIRKVEACAA